MSVSGILIFLSLVRLLEGIEGLERHRSGEEFDEITALSVN
jgi:hypothetical protein